MTDRVKGCVVVFDHDVREDDAEQLLNAIRQLRGVASLTTSVVTPDDYMNRQRIFLDIRDRMSRALAKEGES